MESPDLLSRMLAVIRYTFDSKHVFFQVIDEQNRIVMERGLPKSEEGIPSRIVRLVRKSLAPVVESGGFRGGSSEAPHCLCLPINLPPAFLGLAYLERSNELSPFTSSDLNMLRVLSPSLEMAVGEEWAGPAVLESSYKSPHPPIIGTSRTMMEVHRLIEKVKNKDTPVFIWGESGTGKELVARSIHYSGRRRTGRFVALNCGAIPENLLESELFGYVRGAFTGANRNKPGLVEEADGGSLFLDEVGDLSLFLQAKLLRLLQEREIRRVGETRTRRVNVRFISATNKKLEEEMRRERFREDLYYRLKIVSIDIPPLRDRREDVIPLMEYFLKRYCRELGCSRAYFTPSGVELLLHYSWPGNIRELQNEIQRCLILNGDGALIKDESLSPRINPRGVIPVGNSYDFFRAKADFEKRFIQQALARFGFNQTRTAQNIGLSRQGLFKLIKKHTIEMQKK